MKNTRSDLDCCLIFYYLDELVIDFKCPQMPVHRVLSISASTVWGNG